MIKIVNLWVLTVQHILFISVFFFCLSSGKSLYVHFLKKLAKPSKEKKFNTSGLIYVLAATKAQ